MTTLRPFCRELRRQGFTLDWRCQDVTQFKAVNFWRTLHVQLWKHGGHRVSHGTNGYLGCHECTTPTGFSHVPGMLKAIEFEWQRPSGPNAALDLKAMG